MIVRNFTRGAIFPSGIREIVSNPKIRRATSYVTHFRMRDISAYSTAFEEFHCEYSSIADCVTRSRVTFSDPTFEKFLPSKFPHRAPCKHRVRVSRCHIWRKRQSNHI